MTTISISSHHPIVVRHHGMRSSTVILMQLLFLVSISIIISPTVVAFVPIRPTPLHRVGALSTTTTTTTLSLPSSCRTFITPTSRETAGPKTTTTATSFYPSITGNIISSSRLFLSDKTNNDTVTPGDKNDDDGINSSSNNSDGVAASSITTTTTTTTTETLSPSSDDNVKVENLVVNGAKYTETTFPASSSSPSSSGIGLSLFSTSNKDKAKKTIDLLLKGNIRKVANIASLLCVLDCTVLPIITVILPLLGVLNRNHPWMELAHRFGHALALYFVLPVGGMTTVLNYISHKKKTITTLACTGLLLVGMANSHMYHHILHPIQHGPWHRVTNIVGCAMLLGSNYWSQRQQGCAYHDHADDENDPTCSHDHDH